MTDEKTKPTVLVIGGGSMGPSVVKLLRLRGYDDVTVVERSAMALFPKRERDYSSIPPRHLRGKHKGRPGRRG